MKKILLILLGILILPSFFAISSLAGEEEQQVPIKENLAETSILKDPADLEAFVDGIMAVHMRDRHIAGATFSVVRDGKIFLAKGYGHADIEKKKPVVADRTLFRPGSVSKLFTWTAVMQLVEQGKIDLHADVNTYLKEFKIPATYPEPITMIHLLTHTPGFEELSSGLAVRTPGELMPLGKFLAKKMPVRVRPPGEITSYSNYGTALSGYIVELVSGIPFEAYIEENIFKPLAMEHSTFRQPLPADLAGDMSVGYKYRDGVFVSDKFELINGMAPAGSLSTSAADMAKFMIAHLQNGLCGENRIIKEETARLMHSQLFTHDSNVDGNAYGFWEEKSHGLYTIGHGGDTVLFHSQLTLIPEQNLGFFVSYNSIGGGEACRDQLMKSILDRYYPLPEKAELKAPVDFKKRAEKFCGVYGMSRVNSSTFEKLGRLLMTARVKATDKNTLLIPSGSRAQQWVEVSPLVFKEMAGDNTAVFRENRQGIITHLFLSQAPYVAFIKLKWYETPLFHMLLVAFSAVFFLSTFYWPIRAVTGKICRRKIEERGAPWAARWLAFLMSGLSLAFVVGMVTVLSDYMRLLFGVPQVMKILLVLPIIATFLALGVLFFALLAWIKKYWQGCARLHYTLVLLAFVVFLWFLQYWNLLGFRF